MAKRPPMLRASSDRASRTSSVILAVVLALLAVILCADIWFSLTYRLIIVDGRSMEDTLFSGDAIYIEKGAMPERGDIVVIDVTGHPDLFQRDPGEERYIIKRVIALEGDVVCSENGTVYLKQAGEEQFAPLQEDYAIGRTGDFSPVTVGEGEMFFLGDNRSDSKDSRYVGCLPLGDVVGVVPDFALQHKDFITGWVHFWHFGSV